MAITEQFIRVKTRDNFDALVSSGEVQDTSIAFIEDTAEIWAQGTYYPCRDEAEAMEVIDSSGYLTATNIEDALAELIETLNEHLANNTPGLNHIPAGGSANQILVWESDGVAKWANFSDVVNMEDLLSYGVEWDTTVSDPVLTRIGSTALHKSLPIQNGMYGCICQGSTIMYKLDPDDWRYKEDPTSITVELSVDDDDVITIVADTFSTLQYEKQWIKIDDIKIQIYSIDTDTSTATLVSNDDTGSLTAGTYTCILGSVRNGYDGTVKVYVPAFYYKSETEDTTCRVRISTTEIDSTYYYQESLLIDAYKCTILREVPDDMGYLSTLVENSLISVVNTSSYCRGGSNIESYDEYLETDPAMCNLGKPIQYDGTLDNSTLRKYARLNGDHLLDYKEYKNIFYWLYVIEYANFNCQDTYYSTVDDDGYKQGGLGSGVTTLSNNEFLTIGYQPVVPCGYLDYLGNGSGIGTLSCVTAGTTVSVNRWHGFDCPFGDINTYLDGVFASLETDPYSVYTCDDPDNFADTITDDYTKIGEVTSSYGFISAFNLGEDAQILPSAVDGSSITYMCDMIANYSTSTDPLLFIVGGTAYGESYAGISCMLLSDTIEVGADASIGFRVVTGGATPSTVSVSPSTVEVDADGGTTTISVSSNGDWTISAD